MPSSTTTLAAPTRASRAAAVNRAQTVRPWSEHISLPVDIALAACALLPLLPIIAAAASRAKSQTGRSFVTSTYVGRGGKALKTHRLATTGWTRDLPLLWNVIRGQLALVGPQPLSSADIKALGIEGNARLRVRPGLISRYDLRAASGVAYTSEPQDAVDFARGASLGGRFGVLLRYFIVRALFGVRRTAVAPQTFDLLGVRIANQRMDTAVNWIVERATRRDRAEIAFVNPHCLNTACEQPDYRRAINRFDRVFADGSGVRLACGRRGLRLLDNVNGTDMFPRLLAAAERAGLSLYLLGGAAGVAADTATAARRMFPNLRIVGAHSGYFDSTQEQEVLDEINQSGADILLVAMGVPTQELWLASHRDRLDVPVRMGVGGLFDFYSGRISRAPRFLRELGFEWCWRLLQEPRRMWRRYLIGNAQFLWRVARERRTVTRDEAHGLLRLYRDSRWWHRLRIARARLRTSMWRVAHRGHVVAKRALDTTVAAAALLVLAPLLASIAVAVKLTSRGPVLFRQTRVGRFGREFEMYKFRSMYSDAEARKQALLEANEMSGGVLFKMKDDPRITPIGRYLRKLSLDELPQLWHVLTGEMSLVGPRPPVPSEVAQYTPADRRRLDAVPGITCLWQVSGRSELPFRKQVELDVTYIESQSFWLDIKLLFQTVPAVVLARGAY